jgi:hypothetical protein
VATEISVTLVRLALWVNGEGGCMGGIDGGATQGANALWANSDGHDG